MGVHPVYAALSTPYVQKLLQVKARQLSRKRGFSRDDRDDIEQDFAACILKQAHYFNPDRSSVHTFIDRVVDSVIAMKCRERTRIKRVAERRAMSIERTCVDAGGSGRIALFHVIVDADLCRRSGGSAHNGRSDMEFDCQRVLEGLTPIQQKVAARLWDSSEASIARELEISRRQAHNAIEVIREHFQEAGLAKSVLTRADSAACGICNQIDAPKR